MKSVLHECVNSDFSTDGEIKAEVLLEEGAEEDIWAEVERGNR